MRRNALALLRQDWDERETALREVVEEHLARCPPPALPEHVVATYFFAFRHLKLQDAVAEISYHATNGTHAAAAGSLLARCAARPAGVQAFDNSGRLGLLHIGFPLKMLLQPDGHVTSCDLLHTTAAAIIFDVFENQDARLVHLELPAQVIGGFPGPAHGPVGLRTQTRLPAGEPAFGTILKPTAGLTTEDVEALVAAVAAEPLFVFVKEDENFYPQLDYAPVADRTRRAVAAVRQQRAQSERGLIFAPHLSAAPHELPALVRAVVEAGAAGIMLSETFAGGAVRLVREATRHLPTPPFIYGHNAGIGTRTRAIWREVIDLLARLDGIDFRQTAPCLAGAPFLRPFGREWEASEHVLTMPLPGIKPTVLVRAGGLDQGNIALNLADAARRGYGDSVLFLAGSAINSIQNADGQTDTALGAAAMREAVELHCAGALADVPPAEHVPALLAAAARNGMDALGAALRQRYPDTAAG